MNNKIDKLYDLTPPDHSRGFFDPIKTREWMKKYTVDSYDKMLNKLESTDYKIHASDIAFVEPDKKFTIKEQKQALLDKTDLNLPVRGRIQLINKKTGQVVAEKKTTIASLPYLTERNTTLLNGSEYITTGQQRLKPGVYHRIKESGEVEAHINVRSGTGLGGKILLHPDTALFVLQAGTTQIKLYGLLKDLGISEAEMEKEWGKEIFLKNKNAYEGNEFDKYYSKVFKYG